MLVVLWLAGSQHVLGSRTVQSGQQPRHLLEDPLHSDLVQMPTGPGLEHCEPLEGLLDDTVLKVLALESVRG